MSTAPVSGPEAAILNRLVKPGRADLTPDVARALLLFNFDPADRARMHELIVKAQAGTLRPIDQEELDCYRRIGHFLDLIRSKARLVLRKHAG